MTSQTVSISNISPMKISSLCCYGLFVLVLLLLSCLGTAASYFNSSGRSMIKCHKHEREALLRFKHGIEVDYCSLLSSWGDRHQPDCCTWHGVQCSSDTGHVVRLDLHGFRDEYLDLSSDTNHPYLRGTVSPSLLELKHLNYLDLSSNDFQRNPIPSFIGSLSNLEHLNLSNGGFQGEIPYQLGNLSKLTSLDLSFNYFLNVKGLGWLSHLTLLEFINLNTIDLSRATDWLQVVNNLPFLKVLQMESCRLISPTLPSPLPVVNSTATLVDLNLAGNYLYDTSIFHFFNLTGISTQLQKLDLRDNFMFGSLPSHLGDMPSLSYLDLSQNQLHGPIPSTLGNAYHLSFLDLSFNQLTGQIPDTIWTLHHLIHLDFSSNNFQGIAPPKGRYSLCSIQSLDISNNNLTNELSNIIQPLSTCSYSTLNSLSLGSNQLRGSIPEKMNMFSSLIELDLSSNMLDGALSNRHLSNLSRLKKLDLSNNPALLVNISDNWIPPFQLDKIVLGSCKVGPSFPRWLLTQTKFSYLDLSKAEIHSTIPTALWNSLSSNLLYLNFSHNKIHGMIPELPTILSRLATVDLSSNQLEGAIPLFLGNVKVIALNDNKFSNPIPFLCPRTKMDQLQMIDLSNNLLSGKLPDCWMNFDALMVLVLSNNSLTGSLPPSIGAMECLEVLDFRNNKFHGELPSTLDNCTSLAFLDLSHNLLTGNIPPRTLSAFEAIADLNLRSNKFSGILPVAICNLSCLQILDLSANHLYGAIPECIYNLQIMKVYDSSSKCSDWTLRRSGDIMWKRKEYVNAYLKLVVSINLSDNKLQGEIPSGITSLRRLVSLDLARNNLTGSIPLEIGTLKELELLDLSNNHLSGEIPTSLADVASLEMLDLSNNNLSGIIPTGTQLQSFDPANYSGNPLLCGPPLSNCHGDQAPVNEPKGDQQEHDSDYIFPGLYISIVLGFIIGFWGVCGTLVLKRSWRQAYFRFFDDIKDKLYVMFAVNIARIWRKP